MLFSSTPVAHAAPTSVASEHVLRSPSLVASRDRSGRAHQACHALCLDPSCARRSHARSFRVQRPQDRIGVIRRAEQLPVVQEPSIKHLNAFLPQRDPCALHHFSKDKGAVDGPQGITLLRAAVDARYGARGEDHAARGGVAPMRPRSRVRQHLLDGVSDAVPLHGRESVLEVHVDHNHGHVTGRKARLQLCATVDQAICPARDGDAELPRGEAHLLHGLAAGIHHALRNHPPPQLSHADGARRGTCLLAEVDQAGIEDPTSRVAELARNGGVHKLADRRQEPACGAPVPDGHKLPQVLRTHPAGARCGHGSEPHTSEGVARGSALSLRRGGRCGAVRRRQSCGRASAAG